MAYIVKRKNREGKYYVYLIESFREGDKVKKRTLKAYGSLDNLEKDEPGAFERLRKEAKLGLLHEDVSNQLHVRKEEHIEAHFLTCFLALIFLRVLQNKTNWELSPTRLIEGLKSARTNELATGFYRVQANDDLKRILEILEIKWDKEIVKYEELNKFSKGWYTT